MKLNVHEWGDPAAPPLVCLHGVTAHGARFRRLAEERLAGDFHVVAPDLRGHGRSGWEPPWSIEQQLADVLETTADAGIESAAWMGHSYGGRLLLELAARRPELVERAILLDPAIQLLPHVGYDFAERERFDFTHASPDEAIEMRLAEIFPPPRRDLEEETLVHLFELENGRFRYRYCRAAVVVMYSDMCSDAPPPGKLRAPSLLVHAPEFGLVREEQAEAYRGHAELVEVSGGHVVYWDAYEETAAAIERFLAGPT